MASVCSLQRVIHSGGQLGARPLYAADRLTLTYHRSGAVEQLRVHVRNLGMLGVDGATNSKGRVELYERGYGKDAAGIAKEAIAYGMFSSGRPAGVHGH